MVFFIGVILSFFVRLCGAWFSDYIQSSQKRKVIPFLWFVDILIGVVFFIIPCLFDNIILMYVILLTLLFISVVDIRTRLIPFAITIPLLWGGLLYSPFVPDIHSRVVGAGIGFFMTYLSMLITSYIIDKDVVAGGDVVLLSCAGAWLGKEGILFCTFISSTIFVLYSFPARLYSSGNVQTLPMGPAICLSFIISIWLQKVFY